MPENTNNLEHKLALVLDTLSCGDLDTPETTRIVNLCLQAQKDPVQTLSANYGKDSAQITQYDPTGVTAFIIFVELEDFFAVADTVDELHEQIIAAFENPELPDYPYDDNNFETVSDYFQWLDAQLLAHHSKYRLIHFGQSYTHDFQTILIARDRAEQLLALCGELNLEAEYCQ